MLSKTAGSGTVRTGVVLFLLVLVSPGRGNNEKIDVLTQKKVQFDALKNIFFVEKKLISVAPLGLKCGVYISSLALVITSHRNSKKGFGMF